MNKLAFFKTFLKDISVASVTPTSKHAVKKLCEKIDFAKPGMVIVEYGAGEGVVSKEMLKRMPADGKLILIEQNPVLADHLRKILADPRVTVFTASAEKVDELLATIGISQVDAMMSSIPFTLLKKHEATTLIAKSAKLLGEKGVFVMFQFNPRGKKFLKKSFHHIDSGLVLMNIPPLLTWKARA
ncbi:MAG: rRNA adenine N-6-methyltransferase family protein [Patescibacteria group bacterium]|jgi:phospholipid N-methyltransferase